VAKSVKHPLFGQDVVGLHKILYDLHVRLRGAGAWLLARRRLGRGERNANAKRVNEEPAPTGGDAMDRAKQAPFAGRGRALA
jgi:hypothetical protein